VNLSLVELYPLLPVAWIALLVALALWARREPGRRSLTGMASLLVVVTICVMVRAFIEAPGSDYGSVRWWASVVAVAVTLVVPAGLLGARSFTWASTRGARWGTAYGASAGIAILTSLVAVAIGIVVVLALAATRA
jgi:ABC-type spermidine/putrescine transport system permease subunit II